MSPAHLRPSGGTLSKYPSRLRDSLRCGGLRRKLPRRRRRLRGRWYNMRRSSLLSFLPSATRGGWPGTTSLRNDADAIVPPLRHCRSRSSCPSSSPSSSRLDWPRRRQWGHCPPGPFPRRPSRPVDCAPAMRRRRRSNRRLPRPQSLKTFLLYFGGPDDADAAAGGGAGGNPPDDVPRRRRASGWCAPSRRDDGRRGGGGRSKSANLKG